MSDRAQRQSRKQVDRAGRSGNRRVRERQADPQGAAPTRGYPTAAYKHLAASPAHRSIANDILELQRTVGNRSVAALLRAKQSVEPVRQKPAADGANAAAPNATDSTNLLRNIIQRGPFSRARLPEQIQDARGKYVANAKFLPSKRGFSQLKKMEELASNWLGKKRFLKKKGTKNLIAKFKKWLTKEKAEFSAFRSVDDAELHLSLEPKIPSKLTWLIDVGKAIFQWDQLPAIKHEHSERRKKKVEQHRNKYHPTHNKLAHAKALKNQITETVETLKTKMSLGDKMLDLSVILEVVDKEHRTGRFLQEVFGAKRYDGWLFADTDKDFWLYLNDVVVPKYFATDDYKVKQLTPEERAQKQVTFKGGIIYHGEDPITKPKGGKDIEQKAYNKIIYAMDSSYVFYAVRETYETATSSSGSRFHHSSFFSGGPVRAAGTFEVTSEAKLKTVTPDSGHYMPGPVQMIHVVMGLNKNGVDLNSVRVMPSIKGSLVKAQLIYDCLRLEQENKWQTAPNDIYEVKKLTGILLAPESYEKYIRDKIVIP